MIGMKNRLKEVEVEVEGLQMLIVEVGNSTEEEDEEQEHEDGKLLRGPDELDQISLSQKDISPSLHVCLP